MKVERDFVIRFANGTLMDLDVAEALTEPRRLVGIRLDGDDFQMRVTLSDLCDDRSNVGSHIHKRRRGAAQPR